MVVPDQIILVVADGPAMPGLVVPRCRLSCRFQSSKEENPCVLYWILMVQKLQSISSSLQPATHICQGL